MSAPPPTEPVRLRGGRPIRIAIGCALAAVALIVAGVLVTRHALEPVSGFARVAVSPGTGTVHLSSGSYVAYFESGKVTKGIDRVPLVPTQLTDPSGHKTTLDTLYGGKQVGDANGSTDIRALDYHYQGHNGVALYQFRISQSGTYAVQLSQPDNVPDDAKMAFGASIAPEKTAGTVLVALGVVAFVVGAILLAVGLVGRARHKRQLAEWALYRSDG